MKVITIAGSGRTGSTLVSLLLSQHDDTFNMGQLRDFWTSFLRNEPCTCGERLSNCAIWAPTVRKAFGPQPQARLLKMHAGMSAFVNEAATLANWGDRQALGQLSSQHADYLNGLSDFLESVSEFTKSSTLIDSSKTPEIGLSYHLLSRVDARVINLVRDPRAVASSWEKKQDADVALRMSRIWVQRQVKLAKWAGTLGAKFALVKYEDFAHRPRSIVQQLMHWAELEKSVVHFDTEHHANVSWHRQHLFPPANETVLSEKQTSIDISEANAWRHQPNLNLHRSVIDMAGPLMSRLGYSVDMSVDRMSTPTQRPMSSPQVRRSSPQSGTDKDYVFLICSERSGSNLISAILNSHSEIGSTPPYHLCRDVGLNWHGLMHIGTQSPVWTKMRGLLAARVAEFRSPEDGKAFAKWLTDQSVPSFPDIARQLWIQVSGLGDKQIIFIKENNIHKMLFFILQLFPKAKFVFQVRDPRDYLLSAIKRKEGRFGNKFGSTFNALQVWRDDQLGGLNALAHLGSERVFFQRYEDLVKAPESVLQALCTFLGVKFEPKMLEFNQTDYASDLAVAGGPRENLSKPLMSDNFAKYRKGLSIEQIRAVEIYLGDLMERFGYVRDFDDTRNASTYETMWTRFIEPVECIANAELSPFYSDPFALSLSKIAPPIPTTYPQV